MPWSRSQYEDRVRDRIGDLDLIQHISDTRIPLAIEKAIATLSKDKPAEATQLFSGDGALQTFNLGTDPSWVLTWSRIRSVEHPVGDFPRTYLEEGHDWFTEVDDTGLDTLVFLIAPGAAANNIRVRFTGLWPFPTDTDTDDTIPEVYAQAVADLAAAQIARGKAVEFARQQSTSVAGDLFQRDAGPLFEAARDLEAKYEEIVLGRPDEETSAVAMAVTDVDVFPASIFHRRSDYIEDEALGG